MYFAHHEPSARAPTVNADNVASMIDTTTIVRVTAAVQRAATGVAGPSFVVTFAANFPPEVDIVVSPVVQ